LTGYSEPQTGNPAHITIRITNKQFYFAGNGSGYSETVLKQQETGFGISLIESLSKQLAQKSKYYSQCSQHMVSNKMSIA
jgi:two-component sensor histidine kinase